MVYLSTPCSVCKHPFNWHTGGVCQFDDEVNPCDCIAFAVDAEVVPGRTVADALFDDQTPATAEHHTHAHIDTILDIVDWITPADLDRACAEACEELGIPVHAGVAARIARRQDGAS